MKIMRSWLAIPVLVIVALTWGFGCATKIEKPKSVEKPSVKVATMTNMPPPVVATPAVLVPDMTHAGEALSTGVLVWDELLKSAEAAADQPTAQFTFSFTNVSSGKVVIISVHPSCGCTTAQLPPMPWVVEAGTNGQIGITVNLAGKTGTIFKTVNIVTDRGNMNLSVRITILPPVVRVLSDADRILGMAAAKVDRQAVFKGDCATCHVKPGIGKYGKSLYDVSCGICHEAEHRATMVPDLHDIKTPTNEDFWRTWIMHGKPGSLMPAFSTAEGGPLNDMQIASLAAYLNSVFPSKALSPPQ
jgi:mono/diheme cytochrome c family protein